MSPKKLHYTTGIIGTILLVGSIILALRYQYPHFYTWFALGSWLVFDWLDYKNTKTSILGYFYNHKHRDIFFVFFFSATIVAFLVDYIFGVRISGMWQWPAYTPVHFIRMYIIMNASFILSMYELYRLFKHYFSPFVSSRHRFFISFSSHTKKCLEIMGVVIGVIFLVAPFYSLAHDGLYMEYLMLFPFLGMWILGDSVTAFLGGKPMVYELIRGNALEWFSLICTACGASLITELINLSAHEWVYTRMPFSEVTFFQVPVAVFVGWIPLVWGVIALVQMIRRIDLVHDKPRIH